MFDNGSLWGMHLMWWFVWIILLFWIFGTPYGIPGERRRKETPLDVLKKRYAAGEIHDQEYLEKKSMLEK